MNESSSKSFFKLWGQAIRPFAYPASIMPLLIAVFLCHVKEMKTEWLYVAPLFIFIICLHTATNLYNDFHDFNNGVDRPGTLGSSGLLVGGIIEPAAILSGARIFMGIAVISGFVICFLKGETVLITGLTGIAGAYFYTCPPVNYKYRALGEVMVFILLGPLLGFGIMKTLCTDFTPQLLLIYLAPGFLAAAILLVNNLRDLENDQKAGIKTLPMVIGLRMSYVFYGLLHVFAFGTIVYAMVKAILPLWCAIVLLLLPISIKLVFSVKGMIYHDTQALDAIGISLESVDAETAQFHFIFCLFLIVGILIGWLF